MSKDNASPTSTRIHGLQLPSLLLDLMAGGQWRQPSDEVLRTLMPWFKDALDLLTDLDQIRRESRSLGRLADDEAAARIFRLARGGSAAEPVDLPWLDVDLAVIIAVNRIAGDDVAITLDYRTGGSDPRVVATDIWSDPTRYAWRPVAPTFSAFTAALKLTGPRHYRYVGPAEIRDQIRPEIRGHPITSHDDLATWLTEQTEQDPEEPFTFVIDLNGILLLAPQRSEHVACAAGQPTLSAGEISFAQDNDRWTVCDISNQSTGYCPDVASWSAVQAALNRAGLYHPACFTHPIIFRLCPQCRERNIVKDEHYVCALCDTQLPKTWNMDE